MSGMSLGPECMCRFLSDEKGHPELEVPSRASAFCNAVSWVTGRAKVGLQPLRRYLNALRLKPPLLDSGRPRKPLLPIKAPQGT